MNQTENLTETLNNDFSALTDDNKKSVLEMTKFLILTQNTIIPEMLNPSKNEGKKQGVCSV
jgi:hypothetical protein